MERFKATAGDSGIMNKEQFVAWQGSEDEVIKAKYGKGFEWTAEESEILFKGMQACKPEQEGVAAENMTKFREIRNVIVA